MQYKRIYEFLVWDNCNNNCQFCWQREKPRLYNHNMRSSILNDVIEFIKSDRFVKGSHILVCGGEIFDKPTDFQILSTFFSVIIQFMKQGIIDLLYINTNLIYININGVYDLLEQLKEAGLIERIRFTTSYDIEGRFKSERDRSIMLTNLETIGQKYPNMYIVANTILTKPACEAILTGKFNIKEFMEHNNCWVNLIPYIVLDDKLTADRNMIFNTLRKVEEQVPGYLSRYVPNMAIKQEKWLYMYKDGDFQFCSCKVSEDCGHSVNFKKYCKEGTCFCCDLEEVFNVYM